jgi:hypothetical protein
MPYAQVLTTASLAGAATSTTFGNTLAANSGDSLAVANYNTGGARMLEAWAIDSDTAGEFSFKYTRPESTHDQQYGFRVECPAAALGGAATNAAFNVLPGAQRVEVFKSDTLTLTANATSGDDLVASFVIEYDDLPGAAAVFANGTQVNALRKSDVGINSTAQASATAGAYGTSKALNADDNRLHANTWYALLGASVQTQVTTIALIGPDWGGQKIGMPMGSLYLGSNTWFLDQSIKWGNKAMIPCFNSNNAGSILIYVADAEASTTPKIDFNLVELTSYPGA